MNHWHALIFGMGYPWGKEIQVSENKNWNSLFYLIKSNHIPYVILIIDQSDFNIII